MPAESNLNGSTEEAQEGNPFPNDDYIKSDKQYKAKTIKIEDDPEEFKDEDGWLDILGSGELKKKVIKNGQGTNTRPQRSNWVTLNLRGKVGDEEVESYDNFRFILGDCEVVQGLDVAIALMEKDEEAEIVVPARLAYGKIGKPPNIPPDSTINYNVELLNIEEALEEREMSYDDRVRIGGQKRERGNFWYARGDFSNSIHCYRRALEFLDEDEEVLDANEKKREILLEARLKVYNNLTAAQLKLEAFDAALKSVDFVLKAEPDNVKALFRKGKILGAKNNLDEAIALLRKAITIEPETKIIHQELSRLLLKKKQEEKAERDLYRKMLGQSDSKSSTPKKRITGSKVRLWLQRFGVILSSILVVTVAIMVYKHSTT